MSVRGQYRSAFCACWAILLAVVVVSDAAAVTVVADSNETAIRTEMSPRPAASWFASLYHGFERFASDRPSWQAEAAIVGRRSGSGAAAFVEVGRLIRHGQADPFGAVDLYRPVGRKGYLNVRIGVAPAADVMPGADVYAEGFHSVGADMEASAGYRLARYRDTSVHTLSFGIARYHGNWYFRLKNSTTPINGSVGYAILATVRRYFAGPHEFVGLTVANGREIVGLTGGRVLERDSFSGSVYGQRFLTSNAGVRLGIDVVRDGDLSRWGISGGVVARW